MSGMKSEHISMCGVVYYCAYGSAVECGSVLTFLSAAASDGYIKKCSVPSRSNLHVKFLTFGHSGAQG